MLVTVVNTLEVVSAAEPGINSDVAVLGNAIELLTGAEDPPGNVVEGATRPLESRGELKLDDLPDDNPLMAVVITLVKVVVCPPGATLVITIVVLDKYAEPPIVGLERDGVTATVALVDWLDDTIAPGARVVV